MTRHIILGNGNMLVCLDKDARIRDFYYPHIGQENHVSGRVHRIGVWVNGIFSWVSESDWELSINYKKDTMVGDVVAYSSKLRIKLCINEAVHHERNIYLRKVKVENRNPEAKEVRIFFSQEFQISETNIGDTVYFDPLVESIVHYKGRRYFLIGGELDGKPFQDYATGVNSSDDNIGTYIDAKDGLLSGNAIEHGSVDSVIGFTMNIKKDEFKCINYWIVVGKNHDEVAEEKKFVISETPEKLIKETEEYWTKWVNKSPFNIHLLNGKLQELFKRSLMIINAQTDKNGAIIASNDTHTFKFKKDTYSYMWPRDGALVARSFDKAGYFNITQKFFEFCSNVLEKDGYLLPKYRPDGSVGSSWNSWLDNNHIQLPIQEDETALVLDSLWKHYKMHKSNETKKLYGEFIKKAGDFLVNFRHKNTGLPRESYDLWEEKLGVHTFTCATVYAGLKAAKNFSKIFGNNKDAQKYSKAADEVKKGILKYLYDNKEGVFIKRFFYNAKGERVKDMTIDMSTVYGLFEYKILPAEDERVVRTMEKTMKKLWCIAPCGGIFRYEDDNYYRVSKDALPNPWFISTFWLAEYYITKAKKPGDLKPALDLLNWATKRALPSGVMSEQLSPYDGKPLSVSPLTWSHAGFIIAVIKYLDKFEELNKINKSPSFKNARTKIKG